MGKRAKKEERTFEKYREAGAMMRLLKKVLIDTFCFTADLLYEKDRTKMYRAQKYINTVCSALDDYFCEDFPDKFDPNVFYGSLSVHARSKTDRYVLLFMKSVLRHWFHEIDTEATDRMNEKTSMQATDPYKRDEQGR